MALDDKVAALLNEQINKELFSAYLYLTFADYYDERGLKGFANWYTIQVEEELAHAKGLRRYLLDNDVHPVMEAIARPDMSFDDDMGPLKAALEHEQFITKSIYECYLAAQKVNDLRTMKLLDWYIAEQGEEETNSKDMITNMELFGSDPKGLYDLDREYLSRTFNPPTIAM
ncbi:ferritin [Olsenella massiliensis]|uniref:ferritin n=1 Tax=Olsenella massiliensis TaxID=1622075 RepID=UPI00071D34CA|nr:ferritin [Olsenella massiliensis]